MRAIGLRFCAVMDDSAQAGLANALSAMGLTDNMAGGDYAAMGSVFPVGDGSTWAELWKVGPGMPAGIMLQIVVEDADATAVLLRAAGYAPEGPVDAHGERIYHLSVPGAPELSFQSRLPG